MTRRARCRRCRSTARDLARPRRGRAARRPWSPTGSAPGSGRARRGRRCIRRSVRRSCHPSAGAIGSPVARSHRIVLARWLVMPTTSTVPPAAPVTSPGGVEHDADQLGGVELDQPGERRRRWERPAGHRRDLQPLVDDRRPHARRADVEDEDRRHDRLPGSTPRVRRRWPSRPPSSPASEHDHQVEHDRKPSHVEPTDQAHDDEHGLGGEVCADRRHQTVAEGEADALHPCRASGTERRTRPRRRG